MKSLSQKLIAVLLSAVIAAGAMATVSVSAAVPTAENAVAAEEVDVLSAEPETTAPEAETIVPETTVPVTTVPETTAPVFTVGAIGTVDKTNYDKDFIILKWSAAKNATGYTVYYMNTERDKSYKTWGNVGKTEVKVTGLLHTSPYQFKIVPYAVKDGKKYLGPEKIKKTATNPPVVGGRTRIESGSRIKFSWTRNVRADGYKIYRKSYQTNGKYVAYRVLKGNEKNTFTDTAVESGRGYYYIIRAYRKLNGGSTYHSPESELKMVAGLGAPDFKTSSQLNAVTLSWSKNKNASGYDIYYSTSKNGTYSRLGGTTGTSYTTKTLSNGKTYYFRVRPFKYHGSKDNKIPGVYVTKSQTVTNKIHGYNVSGTFVVISISQQHMWLYKNNKVYIDTPVVTGNADGYHDTPRGYYTIYQHNSPATLVGPGYSVVVSYWMAFCGGCGIHDSTWRSNSEYGGNTYTYNGSHGCVNTPYNAVKTIYYNTKVGTPVIVY